jgi:hypothetical protein
LVAVKKFLTAKPRRQRPAVFLDQTGVDKQVLSLAAIDFDWTVDEVLPARVGVEVLAIETEIIPVSPNPRIFSSL